MSTSNNLLYTNLMKTNVPNEWQGCLNPVGCWWGPRQAEPIKGFKPTLTCDASCWRLILSNCIVK